MMANPKNNPQRNDGEPFADYKARQKVMTKAVKALREGTLFWDSHYEGTFYNRAKQQMKAQRKAEGKVRK